MPTSLARCSATAAASSNVQWTLTDSSFVLSSLICRSRHVHSFTFAAPDSNSACGLRRMRSCSVTAKPFCSAIRR